MLLQLLPGRILWILVLMAVGLHMSKGQGRKLTYYERRSICFSYAYGPRRNCSPCTQMYFFSKKRQSRRCEHLNGQCLHLYHFLNAAECEKTCAPWIMRATQHLTTTPKPILVGVMDYGGEDSD
ncbi:hypothetical protein KR018_009235 [Drosophila ironensis]|nr:hypothetical protein KR018_009235 [Drosophila ironensis]